ncbi:TPA: EamA family transporter RarD [Streptococcus agalactiae]
MRKDNLGIILGLSAYVLWGLLSLYWKLLSGIEAYSTFAYRIIFTVLTMLIYMLVSGRKTVYLKDLKGLVNNKKSFWTMFVASILISINWLVYIFAVTHGHATEASLGYYMMPIISILLSVLVLREHLARVVGLAILIAIMGVGILVYQTGHFPLISLTLALSFGFYGLLKKSISLSSDFSMLVESSFIAPFAFIYIVFFAKDFLTDYNILQLVLLSLSGIITAVPLLLFAEAIKRAPLNIIGFIQYINPTIQLLLALFIFKETIVSGEVIGFIFIWLAILVFSIGQVHTMLKKGK